MYGARCDKVVCGLFGSVTLEIRRGSETPFLHEGMKTLNTSSQVIKLSPKCSGQAHAKRASTGPRNENMEYGCAFGVFRAPSEARGCLVQIGDLIISSQQAQICV